MGIHAVHRQQDEPFLRSQDLSPGFQRTPEISRDLGRSGKASLLFSRVSKAEISRDQSNFQISPELSGTGADSVEITDGLIGLKNVGKSERVSVKYEAPKSTATPIPSRFGSIVLSPATMSEYVGQGTLALYKLIPYDDPKRPNVEVVKLVGPIKEGKEKSITGASNGRFKLRSLCFALHGNGH